jgi:hypothetical protein
MLAWRRFACHLTERDLLDVRLVVFPVRPRASEREAVLRTVLNEMAVQELAAVVGVESQQHKGQPATNAFQCSEDVILALARHAHAFGPAAGDDGGDQREQVLASAADAAMSNQVDLQEADALLVPRRPGAHRDLRLEQGARFGGAETANHLKPEGL